MAGKMAPAPGNLPIVGNAGPQAAAVSFAGTPEPRALEAGAAAAEVVEEGIEVYVMGVPMNDPATLRATQTVFALITVDFFFICDYVLYSLEQGEVNVLWLVLFVALPTTGYFGILNNSVSLLRCFGCLTLLQAIAWSFGSAIFALMLLFTEPRADDPSTPNMDEGSIHQHAEYILLFLFHAFTYTVLTYYGCFLAGKVERGAALPATRRQNREDYSILGLQVADMRTLQDVQNLFNASWLVFFFMLYFSVALFDHAVYSVLSEEFSYFRGEIFAIYCVFIVLWVCMVQGCFVGVKKNNAAALGRAHCIGALFCVGFVTIGLTFVLGCGLGCYRQSIFALYVAGAFFWAASHAQKLRGKVLAGAKLTRPVSEPAQVQVGTILGGAASGHSAAGVAEFAPRPAVGMEGVVMGRAVTTHGSAPAAQQKPSAPRFDPNTGARLQPAESTAAPAPRFDPMTGERLQPAGSTAESNNLAAPS
jgi:hypothetical protein